MPKPVRRARRRSTNARPARTDTRSLIERILDTRQLARVVPRMPPEVLHRVIQACGLEDSGELVALATPDQLSRVFDLDLWRADQPGLDEQFDADRFGLWLEVLMESGAGVAAEKISGMDADLVVAAFAQHVRVFDVAALSPAAPTDDEALPDLDTPHDGPSGDVGGFRILGTRHDSWDAVVGVLSALSAEHAVYFQRVMHGCRSLSNAGFEIDGLDGLLGGSEQRLFDVAFSREQRREQQGFVTPPQARAFLQMARQLPLGRGTTPPANPVASAYFRALDWTDAAAGSDAAEATDAAPASDAAATAAIVGLLLEAGVLPQQPRALLEGAHGPAAHANRIQTQMQIAGDRDPAAFAMRGQELAFLANTIVAGCSLQARPITAQEASDAAVATCNLGLENWPAHWVPSGPPEGGHYNDAFLVEHDLIGVFQVGWTVLYRDVCMFAADGLIKVLKRVRCDDPETRAGLHALRIEMTKHCKDGAPWHAREALDVLTSLDMLAWAGLLGLIDECPVMHAGIAASRGSGTLAVSPSAFEFISENSQIASVHAFMASLPEVLRP